MNRNNPTPLVLLLLTTFLTTYTARSQKLERFYTFDWKECDATHARFYSVAEHTDSGWHRVEYYVQGPTIQEDGWYEDTTWKIKNGRFIYARPSNYMITTPRSNINISTRTANSLTPQGRTRKPSLMAAQRPGQNGWKTTYPGRQITRSSTAMRPSLS